MDPTIRLAEDIAERLGEVPEVAAVALGGSPGLRRGPGLYYLPDVPPDVEGRTRPAKG